MEETKLYRPLGWTTPDESKRLVELGLGVDTCDLWYAERFEATWNQSMNRHDYSETPYYYLSFAKPSERNFSLDCVRDLPCWSLGQLFELIPASINWNERFLDGNSICFGSQEVFAHNGSDWHRENAPSLIESAVKTAVWCLENGYITKE